MEDQNYYVKVLNGQEMTDSANLLLRVCEGKTLLMRDRRCP